MHIDKMHGGCYPVGAREYDCQKEFGMLITILIILRVKN